MPHVVIWDWDGTLVDSFGTIQTAMNAARQQFGLSAWTLDETHANVARSARDVFPAMFGENAVAAEETFYRVYAEEAPRTVRPKGARAELLAALQAAGAVQLVVSNKKGVLLRAEAVALGWDKYFAALVGANDAAADKPSPLPVKLALTQAGLAADTPAVMIGDAPIDAALAHAAGLSVILLADETHSRESLQPHSDCVINFTELAGRLLP